MTFSYRSAVWSCVLAILASGAARPEAPKDREGAKVDKYWVFVGTYTGGKSKGIYRCELDAATGKLGEPKLAAETVNPSFLAVHPRQTSLYAVSEVGDFGGRKSGAVAAFSLDARSGELKLLNRVATGGDGPCHLVVDRTGKYVLVANYGGGSVAVLPAVTEAGPPPERTAFEQHRGKGSDPGRQEAPHAHSVNLDAANRFAFVADLGLDRVFVYRFDPDRGTLARNDPPAVELPPKSGPRHFAFHPSGRFAYVINEMANTVTAMKYDPEHGSLHKLQTVSTLPEGFKGASWTAEVVVHPSGKFLYGSNRGHDSIAIFAIDEKTGELTPKGHQADGIKVPRNFAIDPTGRLLLVANQDGDSVLVFRIDPETGALRPTGDRVEVAKPVCIKFVPKGEP